MRKTSSKLNKGAINQKLYHSAYLICLSPPGLIESMEYPFPLVILMWVYLFLPSLLLNELFTSAVIRDFSRLCGIDVYKVEKSYVLTDIVVQTSSWSRDENRLVEFLTIYMLLTSLGLIFV